jgi:PhoH-like ATPase
MRGRSISQSYLIVDEAQNSTRSQMRDIITRAGKGTKIVICGDINQIDNHTLDRWTNGLVFASEKMKGSDLVAQVTFAEEESVRSALATEALKRLDL